MKALDYLLSLPVAFVLFTAIAGLLYLLGKRMAPKLNKAGGKLLRQVSIFDVYEGEQVPDGKRSLALRLVMRSSERTLSEKDINTVRQRVLADKDRSPWSWLLLIGVGLVWATASELFWRVSVRRYTSASS